MARQIEIPHYWTKDATFGVASTMLLGVIPLLLLAVVAAFFVGARLGLGAGIATAPLVPLVSLVVIRKLYGDGTSKAHARRTMLVNSAAAELDHPDYYFVADQAAIVVDAAARKVVVAAADGAPTVVIPASKILNYRIHRPGTTTWSAPRGADLSTTVDATKRTIDSARVANANTGLYLELDDLQNPKVFIQTRTYEIAESWFLVIRKLLDGSLPQTNSPQHYPAAPQQAPRTAPSAWWGICNAVIAVLVAIIAVSAFRAHREEAAEKARFARAEEERQRVRRQQEENEIGASTAPLNAPRGRAPARGLSGDADSNPFLPQHDDQLISSFAKTLAEPGAVALNSLTMPMLYATKSAQKVDYTVITRLGRHNLPAQLQEVSLGLDNPVSEEARVETVKALIPQLTKDEDATKAASAYLIRVATTVDAQGYAVKLHHDAPQYAGGIYCAGAYELTGNGPLKQACVGLRDPIRLPAGDEAQETALRGAMASGHVQTYAKVLMAGDFANAPEGLTGQGTAGVRFGNGNGKTVVVKVAPVRVQTLYLYDPNQHALSKIDAN